MDKVTELLYEYHDLFPTKFTDLKRIIRDLGVMMLKLDVKLVKQRPYRLNLKHKEKVCVELEKMLITGIIEPMEESDWVSPMVVQEKKHKDEIGICVDLKILNVLVCMIHSQLCSRMKYWTMWEVKKHILSLMDSHGTTRSKSHQRIGARQPSRLGGVSFNILSCHLDEECPCYPFTHGCCDIQGIYS